MLLYGSHVRRCGFVSESWRPVNRGISFSTGPDTCFFFSKRQQSFASHPRDRFLSSIVQHKHSMTLPHCPQLQQ